MPKTEDEQAAEAKFIHDVAEKAVLTATAYKLGISAGEIEGDKLTDFYMGLVQEFKRLVNGSPDEAAKFSLALVDVAATIALHSYKKDGATKLPDNTTGPKERG